MENPCKGRVNLVQMFRDLGNEPPSDEWSTNTQFPHLNTKEYRLRMTGPSQNTTSQEFYECLDINSMGSMVVVTNDYRSRYFVGGFQSFQTLEDFRQRGNTPGEAVSVTTPPITVIKFIQDDLIAVGRVTGTVETWSTNPSMKGYFPVDQKNEHVGMIMDLDVFPKSKNKIVSVDREACIKIWDVNYLDVVSIRTFRHAHGDSITAVSARPGSDDVCVTASSDKSILLWDHRETMKPASGILEKFRNHLTAVSWIPAGGQEESHLLKVGDNGGNILTLDIRNPNEILKEISAFQRSVKKIKCSEDFYAVCGLTNIFKIYNTSDELLFEDSSMTDFIRDVTIHGKKVVSLCWDGNVIEKDL